MADLFNMAPGTLVAGDFRVIRPISAGGMGAVYEVEQASTGKHRALKVMLPQLVADPQLRKRFEQEAKIAALIESEHVVEVVSAGIDAASGAPWLAMELLQGEDLAKTVAKRGALPAQEVLVIFEQLCHAVAAAHRAAIVHRDIKPENIYLAQARRAGATFTVKVLDFGIAKMVAEAKTKQTAAMGSPIWMAPEQADRSPVTPATDVWALGLVAFYLLTGRFFWKAANADDATIPQLMREVLFEPIVPASVRMQELGVGLPPSFDAWFSRCVAREPSARFADAGQAWAAMASALGGATVEYMPTRVGAHVPVAQLPSQPVAPHMASGPVAATGGAASYTVAAAQPPPVTGSPPAGNRSWIPLLAVAVGMVATIAVATTFLLWQRSHAHDAVSTSTPSSPQAVPLPAESAAVEVPSAMPDLAVSAAAPMGSVAAADPPLPGAAPGHPGTVGDAPKPPPAPPPQPAVDPHPMHAHAPASTPTAPPPPQPPPAPPPPPPPPQRSLLDLAHSTTSADWQKARVVLEPRVVGGTASVDEVRLLLEICENQRDRACKRACHKALKILGTR